MLKAAVYSSFIGWCTGLKVVPQLGTDMSLQLVPQVEQRQQPNR